MTTLLAFLPPPTVSHWSDFVGSDWVSIISNLVGCYAELLTLSIVTALIGGAAKAVDGAV